MTITATKNKSVKVTQFLAEGVCTAIEAKTTLPDGTPASIRMRIGRDDSMRRRNRKPARVYVYVPNETIMENLMNRRNRPFVEYKKHIMPTVLDALPEMIAHLKNKNANNVGHVDEVLKARWSQRAGCTCPCSPGFIVDGITAHWGEEVDVWVRVGADEEEVSNV